LVSFLVLRKKEVVLPPGRPVFMQNMRFV